MNNNLTITIILLFLSGIMLNCNTQKNKNTKRKKVNIKPTSEQNKNMNLYSSYSEVLKLQESQLKDFEWPKKLEADLNDDKQNEEFLAVEGYSRGMSYVLYTNENGNWKLISGNETIPSGHLEIKKLDNRVNGWHDFVACQPSGRDGVIETTFTWKANQYVEKEQLEVKN
jgi:hypothetical protein